MFAVPGWSVDSSVLKTQTEPRAAAQKSKAHSKQANAEDSKKRKRNRDQGVTKENLADVWDQVIEGTPGKKHRQEKKERRIKAEQSAGAAVLEDTITPKDINKELSISRDDVGQRSKSKKSSREKSARSVDAKVVAAPEPLQTTNTPTTKLTPLQASMRQKLISARFRHLNQTLYTTPSSQALSLITSNPEMFTEYHEGFRRQVEVWPENPVDGYISTLISRGSVGNGSTKPGGQIVPGKFEDGEDAANPLPRSSGYCTVADLGCGDAAIATALQPHNTKLRLNIHSFDLHSNSPLVTKADIANLPLAESSADVAIFCLALMGTNWIDFIEEAYRVLRWKGELWVAEIKSRFGRNGSQHSGQKVVEHSVGKRYKGESKEMKKAKQTKEQKFNDEIAAVEVDGHPSTAAETDVTAFVEVLRRRGFVLRGDSQSGNHKKGVELGNKMFVKMWFVKAGKPTKGKATATIKDRENGTWKPKSKGGFVDEEEQVQAEGSVLKPCVYKLR